MRLIELNRTIFALSLALLVASCAANRVVSDVPPNPTPPTVALGQAAPPDPGLLRPISPDRASNVILSNDLAPGFASSFVHSAPHPVEPFPIVLNKSVRRYVGLYLDQPEGLRSSFDNAAPYLGDVTRKLEARGLPRDLVYLAFAESEFSCRGAGWWQLSRATARRFGLRVDSYLDERRDPIKSTGAAAEYLATLHDQAGDWRLAIVGWNRGDLAMDHFSNLSRATFERKMDHLPWRTRSLLSRLMAVAFIAHNAEAYRMEPVRDFETSPYDTIRVRGGTPLSRIARMFDSNLRVIRALNPAILRDRVPPNVTAYDVRVPHRHLLGAAFGRDDS